MDDSASLNITQIKENGGSNSAVSSGSSYNSSGTSVTGTYGTLTIGADGSYTYIANTAAAEALDAGDTANDVFHYTVSDGTATDTATITITILGANDAPVAQNDVGVIVENGTLTVSDGANANVSGSYDATGEHTGDVIHTSLSGSRDTDVDGDDTANLVVSAVRVGSSEGSGTAGTLGQALTGTYGQLTLNANGSYSYVANQDAADALDAGDTATDVFNYTVSDGNGGTDTATITITILGATDAPTSTNTTVYKEVKEEGKKKSKQDIRRERRQERKAEKIAAKKFELPESSDKKFNQGLKLVDLVAESNSEDGLSLKFKVFNDEGKEVQKYYGIMKDGSELPAWITVDSKTGKASTDIPKDIDLLEFKIIAVDTDNNKKQVTVIIDPEKISQDKDIMKQVKIKILEMEQGEFDVYNVTHEEPKFMISVLPEEVYSFISGLRIMDSIPGNSFHITLVSYKSYDLMFEAHVAWELDEVCDSIYGGVFEDHPVDCFVCDLIETTVANYYERVGVKQYV